MQKPPFFLLVRIVRAKERGRRLWEAELSKNTVSANNRSIRLYPFQVFFLLFFFPQVMSWKFDKTAKVLIVDCFCFCFMFVFCKKFSELRPLLKFDIWVNFSFLIWLKKWVLFFFSANLIDSWIRFIFEEFETNFCIRISRTVGIWCGFLG